MQDTTDKEKQSCKKIYNPTAGDICMNEETVNLRVNRPFYIDFGCHTHIVNDALTFCTILTKFDFFIKNR